MDQKSTQTCLKITSRGVKFLTVNMLNMNLTHISLHRNKIRTLPPEICQLAQLQSLVADHNLLSSLPIHLHKLSRLVELVVNDNQLESLPDGVGLLSNLEVLHI